MMGDVEVNSLKAVMDVSFSLIPYPLGQLITCVLAALA